ncbi:MAG TPA: sigma-70 family RNA polymerase sigma factor [Phnomibacter sp.]|nr:sigma-70 family RNA polymerase sigma factor [Phnomibacter sp.]
MANSLTDTEIIEKILRGEQQLFAVLVERYQNMVFSVAFRFANNREDAEELAQSAFVKAYQNLANYRGDAKFSTWLYTVVNSICLTFLRKRKLEVHSLDNEKVFERADNLDSGMRANQVETKSKVQMVQQAIGMLAPDDAQVLTLFYQGEQSLEEIGKIMGIDPNTAKVKLHRARQRLKTTLEKNFAAEVKDWREL